MSEEETELECVPAGSVIPRKKKKKKGKRNTTQTHKPRSPVIDSSSSEEEQSIEATPIKTRKKLSEQQIKRGRSCFVQEEAEEASNYAEDDSEEENESEYTNNNVRRQLGYNSSNEDDEDNNSCSTVPSCISITTAIQKSKLFYKTPVSLSLRDITKMRRKNDYKYEYNPNNIVFCYEERRKGKMASPAPKQQKLCQQRIQDREVQTIHCIAPPKQSKTMAYLATSAEEYHYEDYLGNVLNFVEGNPHLKLKVIFYNNDNNYKTNFLRVVHNQDFLLQYSKQVMWKQFQSLIRYNQPEGGLKKVTNVINTSCQKKQRSEILDSQVPIIVPILLHLT